MFKTNWKDSNTGTGYWDLNQASDFESVGTQIRS